MSSSEAMEDLEPGVCAAQHARAGARGDRGGVGRLLAPRPCARASLGRGFSCGYQLWQRHFVRFALDRVEGAFGKALTSPLQVALVPPARAHTHHARVCNQASMHLAHL